VPSRRCTTDAADVIYTDAPGATSARKDAAVVEVDLDSVDILRKPVKAE
jgi:hypothetical protein